MHTKPIYRPLPPRPTPGGHDARTNKAKAAQAQEMAMHKAKAVCDGCGAPLGVVHTEGKMFDIRDPHWIYNLQVLCLPCCAVVEGGGEPVEVMGAFW